MTLLELLVVLLLLGLTAALVLPALRPPTPDAGGGETAAVLTSARRLAVRRGAPVRLRIDTDGAWALVAATDGTPLDAGRVRPTPGDSSAASRVALPIDLTIDALGTCRPAAAAAMPREARFDPLACAWRRVDALAFR